MGRWAEEPMSRLTDGHMNRWTERWTDRWTDRWTERQIARWTDIQFVKQTYSLSNRQTDKQTNRQKDSGQIGGQIDYIGIYVHKKISNQAVGQSIHPLRILRRTLIRCSCRTCSILVGSKIDPTGIGGPADDPILRWADSADGKKNIIGKTLFPGFGKRTRGRIYNN
jgi:hypothetical protein